MKLLHTVAFVILVIGGLHLGIIGFFDYDAVWEASGNSESIARGFYSLVGLAAIAKLLTHKAHCRTCSVSAPSSQPSQDLNL
ncbi:MAG: DUF378 domain-containing protein [Candidatus Harrisonbacteria bacterium]|nr:DUF378 domain-containing protein [Candidatus Harrisonbacteria bacterium]